MRENINSTAKLQKDIYDQKSVLSSYATGDLVLCLNEARREGICTKLQPAYRGSFLVLNKLSAWCYTLADKNGKSWVVNHDKLELYLGDNPPRWIHRLKRSCWLHGTTIGIILNLLGANQRYSICGVVLL